MFRIFNGKKGFTLVELMMVVAIIGILAGIATISSRDMRARYRLKAATLELYSDMQMTRLGAIRNGRIWSICFFVPQGENFTRYSIGNAGGADGDICTVADDPTAAVDPALFRKNVDLSPQSEIAFLNNFNGTNMTFNPRGTASSGNIELRSRNGELTTYQRIRVNGMTGSIRIEIDNLP